MTDVRRGGSGTPHTGGHGTGEAERRRRDQAFDTAELREHLGEQPIEDQAAYVDDDEVDQAELPTDTAIYEGELEAEGGLVQDDPDRRSIELLTERELRAGETDDPEEAAEEGFTYVAPSDPPVIPGDEGEPEIAAGFATSALDDEPYDADHHGEAVPADDEVSDRVREALRADAATNRYADSLAIETEGRVVFLRGIVDDVDDVDNIIAVAERVSGVAEVIEELEVAGLG